MASRQTIVLFDVDGTLTPSRKEAAPEMITFLKTLKGKVGFKMGHFTDNSETPAHMMESKTQSDTLIAQ